MSVAILLVASALISVYPQQRSEWTMNEIAKGVEAREGSIKSYSFSVSIDAKTRSKETGRILEFAQALAFKVDDRSGRFLCHSYGQVYQSSHPQAGMPQESFYNSNTLTAFDGQQTKRLEERFVTDITTRKENEEVIRIGMLFRGRKPFWEMSPMNIVGVDYSRPLSKELLKDSDFQIVSVRGGVVSLETEARYPSTPVTTRYKWRYNIDVSRGFFVVLRQSLLKHEKTSRDWTPFLTESAEDLVQVDGLWLPTRYHVEQQECPPDEVVFRLSQDAVISNWSINPEFKDADFKVSFPEGTMVTDNDRGTQYTVGRITDKSLAKDAAAATALKTQFETARANLGKNPPSDSTGWWIAGGVAVLLASVSTAGLWLVRRGKRPVRVGVPEGRSP